MSKLDVNLIYDDSFTSIEVFPQNFTIFHKDRKIVGGGMFICLHNSLNVSEEPSLGSNVELIWARLSFHRGNLYTSALITTLPA